MSSELPSLPTGWSYVPLEACVHPKSITYGVVQPGTPVERGIPIVRVNNFRETRLDLSDLMQISPEIEAKYARTRLAGGEVLLTLVGSVGQVAVAPKEASGYNVARAVGVIHPLPHISAEWIGVCLRSPLAQHLLGSKANTTVQTTINLKDVRALPIPMPPVEERQRICNVLTALDDRIALLRETNKTLESIAQAIFKSWFVDFDPVRAKMEGRQPEGMDEETAALFPDSLEENSFGIAPGGWQTKGLDDIALYLNGLALQKFPATGNNDLPIIKIAQLRKGETDKNLLAAGNIKSDYIVHDGDVLFSWSGSLEVEIWSGGEGALNQHLFKVTSAQYPKWFYYLWTKHHLPSFRHIAESKATTMGHIQRKHLSDAKAIIPCPKVLQHANKIFGPLLDSRISNALQVRTLTALRDALLPRLISGQLRLPEAQEQVENALS